MDLSEFYKNNVHVFYNIDIIEAKYKEKCKYKTLTEFSKYLKQNILNISNDNSIQSETREVIKDSIYKLFNRKIKKNDITIEQLLKLAKLIDKYDQDEYNQEERRKLEEERRNLEEE